MIYAIALELLAMLKALFPEKQWDMEIVENTAIPTWNAHHVSYPEPRYHIEIHTHELSAIGEPMDDLIYSEAEALRYIAREEEYKQARK